MEKQITLNPDQAIDYIKKNVKRHDILEISYNRIYAPGEVMDMEIDEEGKEGLNITLALIGEILNSMVELDMYDIKDDILEIRHAKEDDSVLIVVES